MAAARSVVRAEVLAGDEVGMAGFTGDDLAGMPAWRFNAELGETQYALLRAGDPDIALVRPPGASTVQALTAGTLGTARRLVRRGYIVVLADRAAQSAARPSGVLARLDRPGAATAGAPGQVLALAASGRSGAAAPPHLRGYPLCDPRGRRRHHRQRSPLRDAGGRPHSHAANVLALPHQREREPHHLVRCRQHPADPQP